MMANDDEATMKMHIKEREDAWEDARAHAWEDARARAAYSAMLDAARRWMAAHQGVDAGPPEPVFVSLVIQADCSFEREMQSICRFDVTRCVLRVIGTVDGRPSTADAIPALPDTVFDQYGMDCPEVQAFVSTVHHRGVRVPAERRAAVVADS